MYKVVEYEGELFKVVSEVLLPVFSIVPRNLASRFASNAEILQIFIST